MPDTPLMPAADPAPIPAPTQRQPKPPPPPPIPTRHKGPPWTKLTRPAYWILVVIAAYITYMMTGDTIDASTLWYGSGYWTFTLVYMPVAAWRAHTMGYPWWICFAAALPIASLFIFFWLGLVPHANRRPPWGKIVRIGIAAFCAIMAVIIVVAITMDTQPSGKAPADNAPTTPQTHARQPSATAYCDDLLDDIAGISATAIYDPHAFRVGMDIAAAQNDDLPNDLGPGDVLFAGLAPNEIFTNENNANKVIAWIQSRQPSECPPDVWNPWVTRIHHDGHGTYTVSFVSVGNQRGFPVTPANQMVFIPETAQGELPTTLAPTVTPEPTERPAWDKISLRTVTGRLVDGFQEPPDVIAVIQTHDGIQHCRMEIQDEAWQEVSIGDTLTVQGIHVDVSEDTVPLLDLCTVTAWAPQP